MWNWLPRVSAVVRRHEILRTTFMEDGGRPMQAVSPESGFLLAEEDLQGLPPIEGDHDLEPQELQEPRATHGEVLVVIHHEHATLTNTVRAYRWLAIRVRPAWPYHHACSSCGQQTKVLS